MKRIRLVLGLSALIVAGIVLSGCAGGTPETLALSDKDSGTAQSMSVGQTLSITLEANPTTGYQWAVDGDVPAQLKQVGEPVYTAESNAMGSGGTEVWTFEAGSAGEGELRLKYWRSFEPTVPPVKTFSARVSVK